MTARDRSHDRYRDLISARVDGQLNSRDQRALLAHLAACPGCRAVERDYRDQRAGLRSLRSAPVPRDMWARTSAALDREMARGRPRRPLSGDDRPQLGRRLVFMSVAAAGVMLALAVTQLPIDAPTDSPNARPARATPFGVPSQALAFLGSSANGLALYRTRVDLVCPASTPDCVSDDDVQRSAVALPTDIRPSTLALSPSGRQLAIVGRAGQDHEDLIGVVLIPDDTFPFPRNGGPPRPDPLTSPTAMATSGPSPRSSGAARPLTTAPPTAAIEGLTVLAIVEGVVSAGAPPAWSAASDMLAFSAMPADGRYGPDVYVWRPNDRLAQRITDDHRSYFASWSGQRIVFSRADQLASQATISVDTAVIDPLTGEQRPVAAPNLWLPAVSPLGHHAVVWFGRLEWKDRLANPSYGTLYVADWAALDPFASSGPSGSPDPGGSPRTDRSPTPSLQPNLQPTPRLPSETDLDDDTSPIEPTEPTASSSTAITELPAPPDSLTAVEPDWDVSTAPVVDWQVRWSSDGRVLGYWVADAPGGSWGRLAVLGLDTNTGVVDHAQPLLGPTLARRGFTLGLSRVAWIAPTDAGTEGELRVHTWGLDGVGLLRLRRFDLTEVLPAF